MSSPSWANCWGVSKYEQGADSGVGARGRIHAAGDVRSRDHGLIRDVVPHLDLPAGGERAGGDACQHPGVGVDGL